MDLQTFRASLDDFHSVLDDCRNFSIEGDKATVNGRGSLDLAPHQTITPTLRTELEKVFSPYNTLLETMIGPLPWTY